jgi:protein-S-isoprenylcysteine O-methyltransferase Ste14
VKTAPAALGAAVWFVLAPGVVSGLIPWWLTRWQARELGPWWVPLQVVGGVLIVGGTAVLVHAFARFVSEGRGTPVPVAPPERLVVGGLYRYVRNPMYVAVVAVILGQALLLARWELLAYAGVVAATVTGFVMLYEEPELSRRFGTEYSAHRAGVRRWWPRLRPWQQP